MPAFKSTTGNNYQFIYEFTVTTQPMMWMKCEGWQHHKGLRPLLFSNSGVG